MAENKDYKINGFVRLLCLLGKHHAVSAIKRLLWLKIF
jgi:hypothetical protein